MKKFRLKYTKDDLLIKLPLLSTNDFYGDQQGIDSNVNDMSELLINEAVDTEIMRFRYKPNQENKILSFEFTLDGLTYSNKFNYAGFSDNDVKRRSESISNSYFFMEYYDNFEINNQQKLSTKYLTKVYLTDGSGPLGYKTAQYILNNQSNQFHFIHIPIHYLNQQTNNEISGYLKFYFYCAKDGSLKIFNNESNKNLSTPLRMYFQVILNISEKTWEIQEINQTVIARQVYDDAYTKKMNNTFENKKKTNVGYPTNLSFDPTTGKYF